MYRFSVWRRNYNKIVYSLSSTSTYSTIYTRK